ncbi:hypothetical protein HNV08_05270 [Winogradskyella eckloniae]|uniref:hypothetical protein n=1 Tax=Winogradskyella eckloniae TaxID=1089306 RepID=UPI0015639150|nr:hypothetical protein [Winogradskyella eckloniae]NRD19449.1 hypothetical protein [Winogradskyella eckloniae]
MKKVVLLLSVLVFITSCNVTESIVFKENMAGEYKSSFDLSPMMQIAGSQGPTKPESEMKKMDTTIVFSDLFKTHMDSIATLSVEERAKLEKLKGMIVHVNMDEANKVFEFSMTKPFQSVKDLKTINDQMDEAFGIVKDIGSEGEAAPEDQMDELTKVEEVNYTFVNNTFSRVQPASLIKKTEDETEAVEGDDEATGESDFGKQIEMQFEEIFAGAFYTLTYTFPRKVKSVSNANATVSEDGKTVHYKVAWSEINKDETVMNLDVVLED